MALITGVAKRHDGSPVDYVLLFDWESGAIVGRVIPSATGEWEFSHIAPLNIGITYIAFGCSPITHGSYSFAGLITPNAIYASGVRGVWYDPSDLSTLFQDYRGTIPVTAAGQPVGMIKDKSGGNFHATQSDSTLRPTYGTDGTRHWLYFKGSTDPTDLKAFASRLVSNYNIKSPTHLLAASVNLLDPQGQVGIVECFDDSSGSSTAVSGSRLGYYNEAYFSQLGSRGTRHSVTLPRAGGDETLIANAKGVKVTFSVDDVEASAIHTAAMAPAPKTYIGSNSDGRWTSPTRLYGVVVMEKDATAPDVALVKTYLDTMSGKIA